MSDLEAMLANVDPRVRGLLDRARALVREAAPEAVEKPHPRTRTICFDVRRTDDFVYLNVNAADLNVGFFRGVELPDPDGLLRGSGKRMRHVKVHREGALGQAALADLVAAALALA